MKNCKVCQNPIISNNKHRNRCYTCVSIIRKERRELIENIKTAEKTKDKKALKTFKRKLINFIKDLKKSHDDN